jgi:hypothetical protein
MPLPEARAGPDAELRQVVRPGDGDRHRPAGRGAERELGEAGDDEAVDLVGVVALRERTA